MQQDWPQPLHGFLFLFSKSNGSVRTSWAYVPASHPSRLPMSANPWVFSDLYASCSVLTPSIFTSSIHQSLTDDCFDMCLDFILNSIPTAIIFFCRVVPPALLSVATPSQELSDCSVPLASAPPICQGHHHHTNLTAFQGVTQRQLVFVTLNSMVPNCLSNPMFHSCPVLPPPPLHPCLYSPPFPTLNAPFFLRSGYHRGPGKTCLLQEERGPLQGNMQP